MKLSDLGFDPWFESHADEFSLDGYAFARVSAVDRGSYLLEKESEHYEMSYLEKRRKDRIFGRFIKSAKKRKKD